MLNAPFVSFHFEGVLARQTERPARQVCCHMYVRSGSANSSEVMFRQRLWRWQVGGRWCGVAGAGPVSDGESPRDTMRRQVRT